jgi:hypothetical protein
MFLVLLFSFALVATSAAGTLAPQRGIGIRRSERFCGHNVGLISGGVATVVHGQVPICAKVGTLLALHELVERSSGIVQKIEARYTVQTVLINELDGACELLLIFVIRKFRKFLIRQHDIREVLRQTFIEKGVAIA